MNRKLQVFVSSTFTDMQDERQAAVEAILEAGHIPAGMELFAAGDESQWATIKRWIDDSDVYMLILGGRYGTIEPTSNKSYTEQEYHYAVAAGKPHFAAVISEEYIEAKVRQKGSKMKESDHGVLLREFREQTVIKKTCKFFVDLSTLKYIVFQSLANIARDEKLPGWVKGSEVVDPKFLIEENNRLRQENAKLLQQKVVAVPKSMDDKQQSLAKAVLNDLSKDARVLLAGCGAGDGTFEHFAVDKRLTVGGASSIDLFENRARVRWESAFSELHKQKLIYRSSHLHGKLEHLGYLVFEELKDNTPTIKEYLQ